jgi:hypothetical protein
MSRRSESWQAFATINQIAGGPARSRSEAILSTKRFRGNAHVPVVAIAMARSGGGTMKAIAVRRQRTTRDVRREKSVLGAAGSRLHANPQARCSRCSN